MSELLEQLFAPGNSLEHCETRSFMVLKKGSQPFLLLPTDRAKAACALSLYPAQKTRARLARTILSWALGFRLPLTLPNITLDLSTLDPFTAFLQAQAGTAHVPDFAVLIGNPHASGQRQVLLLFNSAGDAAVVVKAGAGEAAMELIERERSFLESTSARVQCIPKLRGHFDSPSLRAFALDYVEGAPPSANDPTHPRLAEALLSWIDPLKEIELRQTPAWSQLARTCASSPLFQSLSKRLADKHVHPVIQHGDFVPWNIKVSPQNGQWRVLDWERGQLTGVPAWDWFHFMIQTSILVQGRQVKWIVQEIERLFGTENFKNYATRAGIKGIERDLLLLYLLHTIEVVRPTEGGAQLHSLLKHLTRSQSNETAPTTIHRDGQES